MDTMKRLLFIMLAAGALAACNKPTEENCRKALSNMQRLMGTENVRDPELIEGEVRRCKGGSKKGAVDCAIKAQTFDELKHCNFYHLPDNALPSNLRGSGANAGSAGAAPMTGSAGSAAMDTGSAGSAAMGSAATGSAAMGSAAMGSAAMGSAAGSAATGTGSAGSAANAGSAAKAGSPAKTGSAGSAAATK
jgi:hypothetical protein